MEMRLQTLEEQVAHLQKQLEEMSDVLAERSKELDLATQRIGMLMQREAEREASDGGSVVMADQRPPHY